jgi:hypothetical protein
MFVVFAFSVETSATNQLSAAPGTVFLIAIRMMDPSRHYIAVGTAEPMRKMSTPGVIGYGLKDFPVRVLNGGISRTGCDGCVQHFLLTTPADTHCPS